MHGADISQPALFITSSKAGFAPKDLPLRALRALIDGALASLDGLFDPHYADLGKASVAPERLIRESILEVIYAIRSERHLVEQIRYNLLCRRFVGLEMDARSWHHPLQQEPRTAARSCHATGVVCGGAGAGTTAPATVRRSLQHRQETDRRLGIAQERSPTGQARRHSSRQGAGLPRETAHPRDA